MISDDHFRKFHPTQLRPDRRGWLALLRPARVPSGTELYLATILVLVLFAYLFYNFFVALATHEGAA